MEQRKASDILLKLESQLELISNTLKTQDFNMKILSNKLNAAIEKINALENPYGSKTASIEAISTPIPTNNNPPKIIIEPINEDYIDKTPNGVRRTARNANDSVSPPTPQTPAQVSQQAQIDQTKASSAEAFIASLKKKPAPPVVEAPKQEPEFIPSPLNADGKVSVMQRVTDKSGRSIFLADIEVFDGNNNSVARARTSANGKWISSLPPGKYRVNISKKDPLSKEKIEVMQNITVGKGKESQDLPAIVIK